VHLEISRKPIVSVIMPAYNAAAHIAESIASVQQQTYEHWELIIINDGSTDNTESIARLYAAKDPRIVYIEQLNGKQGKARNTGIKVAKGTLVAFIDADDIWMPHKLQEQIAFINLMNADVVFSDTILVNEDGVTQKDSWGVKDQLYKGEEGLLAFMEENKAPLLTVVAKKESVLSVNGFSESLQRQYVEDYDLWLRMLQSNNVFAGSSERLAAYRLHTNLSMERKKSILHVVDVLKEVHIRDQRLLAKKHTAIILWIRKCIKTCLPAITSDEMQKIIALFPSSVERNIFSFLNSILKKKLLGRLILLYSRSIAKNNFDNFR
jgi:teichuronic acid biosynthesis glycosyltransferase TuaG